MRHAADGRTAKGIRGLMRILTVGILDGYQRRKDRTVSLRFVTQEKTSQEVMEIDQMVDSYGVLYFRAEEQLNQEEIEYLDSVDVDVYDQPKTQSQRLRNVLYMVWQQEGSKGEFREYYRQQTERIIGHYKNKLNDE